MLFIRYKIITEIMTDDEKQVIRQILSQELHAPEMASGALRLAKIRSARERLQKLLRGDLASTLHVPASIPTRLSAPEVGEVWVSKCRDAPGLRVQILEVFNERRGDHYGKVRVKRLTDSGGRSLISIDTLTNKYERDKPFRGLSDQRGEMHDSQ
jgi:hypothetical protein